MSERYVLSFILLLQLLGSLLDSVCAGGSEDEVKIEVLFMPENCTQKARKGDLLNAHYDGFLAKDGSQFYCRSVIPPTQPEGTSGGSLLEEPKNYSEKSFSNQSRAHGSLFPNFCSCLIVCCPFSDFFSHHISLSCLFCSRSAKKGDPHWFVLGVGEVIKGLDLGLKGMCPGEKRKITVPPSLAFGEKGKRKLCFCPDCECRVIAFFSKKSLSFKINEWRKYTFKALCHVP